MSSRTRHRRFSFSFGPRKAIRAAAWIALGLCVPPALAVRIITNLIRIPGGDSISVNGVSPDGTVVTVEASTATAVEAFRFTVAGGSVGLGVLPGNVESNGQAASNGGTAIAADNFAPGTSRFRAARWTAATVMQDHGLLPSGTSVASGITCMVMTRHSLAAVRGMNDCGGRNGN
jgi:hypothetical protein